MDLFRLFPSLFEPFVKTISFVLFGTRYKFPLWQFSILLGLGLVLISLILSRRTPHNSHSHSVHWKYSFPYLVIAIPIAEEIVFRLVSIAVLWGLLGSIPLAIFISAVFFGIAHLLHGTYRVLDTFINGLILGLVFVNFGLLVPVIAHMTVNFVAYVAGK